MALTSAWAVGSFVSVTEFTPLAMTLPSFTTTAPKGPPCPPRTFSCYLCQPDRFLHEGIHHYSFLVSGSNTGNCTGKAQISRLGFPIASIYSSSSHELNYVIRATGRTAGVGVSGANRLFRWTRIPDVVVLMATGLLIGPGLGWAHPDQFKEVTHAFGTLALILILFEGGLDLNIRETISHFPGGFAVPVC